MAAAEHTDTGTTNAEGRTIYRGPRGGLYVLINGKKSKPAAGRKSAQTAHEKAPPPPPKPERPSIPANATHYQVLGIPPSAFLADIKAAYRKAALLHHPNKGGDTATFQRVGRAYETLSDPSARRAYDQLRPRGPKAASRPMASRPRPKKPKPAGKGGKPPPGSPAKELGNAYAEAMAIIKGLCLGDDKFPPKAKMGIKTTTWTTPDGTDVRIEFRRGGPRTKPYMLGAGLGQKPGLSSHSDDAYELQTKKTLDMPSGPYTFRTYTQVTSWVTPARFFELRTNFVIYKGKKPNPFAQGIVRALDWLYYWGRGIIEGKKDMFGGIPSADVDAFREFWKTVDV